MAKITKPESPDWVSVTPLYNRMIVRHTSPFTLESQSLVWPGKRWVFQFELPPLVKTSVAQDWITFLFDLADGDNYFEFEATRYVPAKVLVLGSKMNLRLTTPVATWTVGRAKKFGITFEAETYQ